MNQTVSAWMFMRQGRIFPAKDRQIEKVTPTQDALSQHLKSAINLSRVHLLGPGIGARPRNAKSTRLGLMTKFLTLNITR